MADAYPGNKKVADAITEGMRVWWEWWQTQRGNAKVTLRIEGGADENLFGTVLPGPTDLAIKAILDSHLGDPGIWPANGAAMAAAMAPCFAEPLLKCLGAPEGFCDEAHGIPGAAPRIEELVLDFVTEPAGTVITALSTSDPGYCGNAQMATAIMYSLVFLIQVWWTNWGMPAWDTEFTTPFASMNFYITAALTAP